MAVTDDLAEALELAGVGVRAIDLYAGGWGLPDLPAGDPPGGIVGVFESPVTDPSVRVMGAGPSPPATIRPRVQILARGPDYVTARAKATAAVAALDWLGPVMLGGGRVEQVEVLQREPAVLERDASDRFVMVFNAVVTRGG